MRRSVSVLNRRVSSSITPRDYAYSHRWLRDHCPCSECVHPTTRQKLHTSGSINHKIQPITTSTAESSFNIKWNDGHNSSFLHDYLSQSRPSFPPFNLWQASTTTPLTLSYKVFLTSSGYLTALTHLRSNGIFFISGMPDTSEAVESVALLFGESYASFYGKSWAVKSSATSKNIAYTSLPLPLHMDLMYYESPPGIQLLHVLKNSVNGGESTFLDGYNAIRILKQECLDSYNALMSTQVTFAYQNDGKHYSYTRPTIQPTTPAHTLLTDLDLGYNLFYSPPFQTRVNTINDAKFYKAIAKFEEILGRPGMMLRKRMEVGTCAVFLNRRVLHGRESFDEGSGERYLRGTYVGLDCYHDKIRMHLMNKSVD